MSAGTMGVHGGGYRTDLDGLRALSILLVVGYHAGLATLSGGYVGVDVFLVISGYLITTLLLREIHSAGRIDILTFLAKRMRRLLPMAVVVVTVTTGLGMWLVPPVGRERLLHDATSSLLYVANWRFAFQATDYSAADVTQSLFLHYWSLSVEEQFYVLWPLLIMAVAWTFRGRRAGLGRALFSVVLLATTASLAASVLLTPVQGARAYYATHTRLWEIGVGALLAFVIPRLPSLTRWFAEVLGVAGAMAIVVAAITFDSTTAFPGWVALAPVLGTAAVIASASRLQTGLSRALSLRPLPYVGRLSYGWYLWHWPAIGVGLLLRDRWDLEVGVLETSLLAIVVAFVLSAASHALIENPVRYSSYLRVVRRRTFAMAAGITALPLFLLLVGPAVVGLGDTPVASRAATAGATGEQPSVDGAADDEVRAAAPMSPSDAANDEITVGPDGCHAEQATAGLNVDCVAGDPDGARTLVLTGDSHARHWLPALDRWGRERGWQVIGLTKSACVPLDVPIWNLNLKRPYVECREWNQARNDALGTDLDADVVVVAHSYAYRGAVLDEQGRRTEDDALAQQAWAAGAARTFSSMLESVDGVIVLRDTPWAEDAVPECLSVAQDPSECSLDLDQAAHRGSELFHAAVADAPQGVTFFDPTSIVCPDDPCPMTTEHGLIKYSDRHHLTQAYSTVLGDPLGDALDVIINTIDTRHLRP